MTTPIYDFLKQYAARGGARFHMPGHKGRGPLGCEPLDITEITGADVLGDPTGIIAESEENATALFGTAHTYYSTEGSTLAIKAMLTTALYAWRGKGRPTVVAGRNAHRAFLHGAALLDFNVAWVYPRGAHHYSGGVTHPQDVEKAIEECDSLPFAVYVTSPNYLGEISDVAAIAAVCRRYGIPLLVDNAHGAYLAFLSPSLHPIHLGAAMCADSAHKTLPVLTGGAYLHVAKEYANVLPYVRDALSLFASSSPSYLTLASLDRTNALLPSFSSELYRCIGKTDEVKASLTQAGLCVAESEPLKLVLRCEKADGAARALSKEGIEVEMADGEHLVLMISPYNTEDELNHLKATLLSFSSLRKATAPSLFLFPRKNAVLSPREAVFAPSERIETKKAEGRIFSGSTVSCPPAVPIVTCGERIDGDTVELLLRYGHDTVAVVKES